MGPQDVPREVSPPNERDEGVRSNKICGGKFRVYNRTDGNLKFVYSWGNKQSLIYEAKKKTTTEVERTYCYSHLTVVTNKEPYSIDVTPGKEYELVWSSALKRYLLQAIKTED